MCYIVPGTGIKNGKSEHILDSIWEVVPTGLCRHLLWIVKEKGKSRLTLNLWFKQLGTFTEIMMTKGEKFQDRWNRDNCLCFLFMFKISVLTSQWKYYSYKYESGAQRKSYQDIKGFKAMALDKFM